MSGIENRNGARSYAEVLGRHAAQAAMAWPQMPLGPARESLQFDAAALRSLAALVERAEKFGQPLNPDMDLLSSGEQANFEEWDAIVRELAAGYSTPTETSHE